VWFWLINVIYTLYYILRYLERKNKREPRSGTALNPPQQASQALKNLNKNIGIQNNIREAKEKQATRDERVKTPSKA